MPASVNSPAPAVWEAAPAAGAFLTLPERACQVTVRFFTVSGHDHRDVVLFADDYLQRKTDGSIAAYLHNHVIPRLKEDWYPLPVDFGDRRVMPVMLADGVYVEDPGASNPPGGCRSEVRLSEKIRSGAGTTSGRPGRCGA